MQHSADTIWFPLIPILPQKYHTQSCHSNRTLSFHISLRLAELPSLSHSRFWESPTQGIYMIVVTRHGVDLSKNRVYNLSRCMVALSRYGVNLWMFLGILSRFDISLKVWSGSLKVFGKHFTEYLAFLSRCPTCSQGLMHLSTYWTYTLQVSYISQGMGTCRTYDTSPRFGKNHVGFATLLSRCSQQHDCMINPNSK